MSTMLPDPSSQLLQEERPSVCRLLRQQGFSILSALFLLVVLSVLGATMAIFSTVQHTTSAQDVQGSRAYQAARAGIEWGLYQVMRSESALPACPQTPELKLAGSLAGFAVKVTCSSQDFMESGETVRTYEFISTATSGAINTPTRIERQLQISISI